MIKDIKVICGENKYIFVDNWMEKNLFIIEKMNEKFIFEWNNKITCVMQKYKSSFYR